MDQEPINVEHDIAIPAKILEIAVLKEKKKNIEKAIDDSKKLSVRSSIIITLFGVFYGGVLGYFTKASFIFILSDALGCILVFFFYVFALRTITNIRRRNTLRQLNLKLLEAGAQELKDNIEKEFFTKLVEINFKYIDQYYLQTQEQADKSFRLTVIAGVVGFSVMLYGIIMLFDNSSNSNASYLATASGIITQFIASVFFYLYNQTIVKMSQYHQKLVITQNISLALKTADSLSESKDRVLEKIIDSLIADVNKHLSNL